MIVTHQREDGFRFSYDLRAEDAQIIRRIVEETEFFTAEEISIAVELIEDRLEKGDKSTYRFVLAKLADRIAGYSCFGRIPGTESSYDLYWIAVDTAFQNNGLGTMLIRETERLVRESNGMRMYVETSDRPQYSRTRAFYLRCSYVLVSTFDDFYAPGDGKAVYCKILSS